MKWALRHAFDVQPLNHIETSCGYVFNLEKYSKEPSERL
jgi:hypothetical protein